MAALLARLPASTGNGIQAARRARSGGVRDSMMSDREKSRSPTFRGEKSMKKLRLPKYFYNRTTIVGTFITAVAAAVLFLTSDAAEYITGQALIVDGGRSLNLI